jgi:hypothetical protein
MKNALFIALGAALAWMVSQLIQQRTPKTPCTNYLVRIPRAKTGAIEFSTIPAQLNGSGIKVSVENTEIILQGTALVIEGFEKIAAVRGWQYTKEENC